MKTLSALMLSLICLMTFGCKDPAPMADAPKDKSEAKKEAPSADKEAPAAEEKETLAAADQKEAPKGPTVIAQPEGEAVTAEALKASGGAKFDPPIEKAQVPEGAWYCDMGTVHYGQMHEGDAKCPLCNMKLVHNKAAAAP